MVSIPSLFVNALPDVQSVGGLVLGAVVAAAAFSWLRAVVPGGGASGGVGGGAVVPVEFAGENEGLDELEANAELDAAMATWEDSYYAQLLRQHAGEYVPGEWIGSDFAADVEGR